ncbi:hypothetical protein WICPIJ_009080 [Wickerhamomyces pijperi]|uniref:Uncharacterized protein n=1 Tax=Wickerhamomyces pijperi TaxID=599730 RepID=A0A9P8PRZ3_WICPI|nr:hypothetical protein WICPIJ_009080 [Wickerhamomyces pijperi]
MYPETAMSSIKQTSPDDVHWQNNSTQDRDLPKDIVHIVVNSGHVNVDLSQLVDLVEVVDTDLIDLLSPTTDSRCFSDGRFAKLKISSSPSESESVSSESLP